MALHVQHLPMREVLMNIIQPFSDRHQAGRALAKRLMDYKDRPDVVVLALPRGGVPVAFEVAQALNAPLDVFIVRKLGVPGHEELAMGAIASGGVRVLNPEVLLRLRIDTWHVDAIAKEELQELERRAREYRGDRPLPDLHGKTVILIDDGLATGATMRAAAKALHHFGPAKIVVAVPAASPETCDEFRAEVDEIICAITPDPFYSVGSWYKDFSQTSDEEVHDLLARASSREMHHDQHQSDFSRTHPGRGRDVSDRCLIANRKELNHVARRNPARPLEKLSRPVQPGPLRRRFSSGDGDWWKNRASQRNRPSTARNHR
jgi:predicted phosphoribosyltransferase